MTIRSRILIVAAVLSFPAFGQIDVPDHRGDIKIEPLYQGVPLQNLDRQYRIEYRIDNIAAGALSPSSPTVTHPLAVGQHTVELLGPPVSVFSTDTVTIQENVLTEYRPELGSLMGQIRVHIVANGGLPDPNVVIFGATGSGGNFSGRPDANGDVLAILPVGTYSAGVGGPGGQSLSFQMTVVAGKEIDLGTKVITYGSGLGDLKIEPLYQGVPLQDLGVYYLIEFQIDNPGGAGRLFPAEPTVTRTVTMGPHTIDLRGPPLSIFLTETVTVTENALTEYRPELGSLMGYVRATVTLDGAVPAVGQLSFRAIGSSGNFTIAPDAAGVVRGLLPAGTYTGRVSGGANVQQLTFSFTVFAGQEVDLGTKMAVSIAQGSLTFSPLYRGQPLTSLGAPYRLEGSINGISYASLTQYNPTYSIQLNSGPYDVAILGNPSAVLTSATVNVSDNVVTQYSPEMSSLMGLVRGTVLINGTPPDTNLYAVGAGGNLGSFSSSLDATGLFRALLPAGNYTGFVAGPTGVLFNFPFSVLAGLEVDLGSPGVLQLNGTVGTGSGTTNGVRTWPFRLTNSTASSFFNVRVTSFSLVRSAGPTCFPTVQTALPVNYGLLANGATVAQNFSISFAGCAATTRFILTATVANDTSSQIIVRANLFQ